MFKKIIAILLFPCLSAQAQEQDSISLDLLQAPTSVAFNLLGVAQNDIERPTDLTSFAFSVKNASNNFTKFPSNYSAEFAPGWLARKPNLTLDRFNSIKFKDVFWQSFLVSFGVSRQDEEERETDEPGSFLRTGMGLKFSIFRPTWTGKTKALYDSIVLQQQSLLTDWTPVRRRAQQNDQELARLQRKRTAIAQNEELSPLEKELLMDANDQLITARKKAINDSIDNVIFTTSANYQALKESAASFKFERQGAFLDLAGGMVLDFPDERFNYSELSKAGIWLTGGYESGNKGVSFLAIARFLHQPDKIFADDAGTIKTNDISTLDGGARIAIKGAEGRFNLNAEAIYRSALQENTIDPNWRLVFSAEYDVGMNQKLSFSFGKNFDRTITKGGNLITALNFIKGFGSKRRLKSD